MDSITHKGKEYKKVAILAKEFNYTADYIGQLCREDKVDARLVGRAWYVYPESLREHKKGRYQDDFTPPHQEENKSGGEEESTAPIKERIAVEPVRTNKTVKIIKHIKRSYQDMPVKYEADEGSLIPAVVKPRTESLSVPKQSEVDLPGDSQTNAVAIQRPAEAVITEESTEKHAEQRSTGKVEIHIEEERSATGEPDQETVEIDINKVTETPAETVAIHVRKAPEKLVKYSQNAHLRSYETLSETLPAQKMSFHPTVVQQVKKGAIAVKKPASKRVSAVFSLIIIVFALLTSFGLLFLGTETTAGAESMTVTFFFDTSLFERFYTYSVFPI